MQAASRESGVVVVTALVVVGLTLVVGIPAGLIIVGQSTGCDDVIDRVTANQPVTQQEIDRCASAFPKQLSTAGLAASFVPTGADDAIVTQPMAALVDRASQPAPTSDAPLPQDVAEAVACGNGKRDPGEECDVTAPTIGCSGQACVSCSCLTIPPLPECPDAMPSHLGEWKRDASRGGPQYAPNGFENTSVSAACYYLAPNGAGLPADGHLQFFVYAVHPGLSDAFLKGVSCTEETFLAELATVSPGARILDTGEPDWYPTGSGAERLVSPDRCAAVTVTYYPTGGSDVYWLRAHPRVVFEAHALAEQLFFKAEVTAFKRP